MYWIIGTLVAVCVGYGLLVWNNIRVAIHKSIAIDARTVPYEQHPTAATMRILVAGDSTAAGVGAIDSAESVAGRIGQDFPSADITNKGVTGDRLADLEATLAGMQGQTFDLVVLQIGANDVTGRTSYADIRRRLSAVLGAAERMGERVLVMTAGNIGRSPVFYWPVSAYLSKRSYAVREIFIDEIQKHPRVSYVNLLDPALDDLFNKEIARYYASDLFHPSGEGYGLWYQKVRPILLQP